MKAIVLTQDGSPEDAFEIQDRPIPEIASDEVLIKVSHSGLNYADVMSRKGLYNDRPELPVILGYDVAGVIEAVGSGVSNFEKGDLVVALTQFGGYAAYAKTKAEGAIRLAPGTNPEEATALATQYSTAWYAACLMINLFPGDRVLVHAAAGGVGTALVQIAKWKGCEVVGTIGSDHKAEHLTSMGVDHIINYRKTDFEIEVKNLLDGNRLDVVFDPIGGKNFKKSLSLLGSGGRMVSFGASEWSASKGRLLDKLKLVFGFGFLHPIGLLMKSKAIIGVNMLRIGENKPEYLERCLKEVYDHYQQGILKPKVDAVFDYTDIDKAHARLDSRDSIGKVVVKWS